MAKRMGVPIGRLCAGVNVNDITHRTIQTGKFHKSDCMHKTLSDAINIQIVRTSTPASIVSLCCMCFSLPSIMYLLPRHDSRITLNDCCITSPTRTQPSCEGGCTASMPPPNLTWMPHGCRNCSKSSKVLESTTSRCVALCYGYERNLDTWRIRIRLWPWRRRTSWDILLQAVLPVDTTFNAQCYRPRLRASLKNR